MSPMTARDGDVFEEAIVGFLPLHLLLPCCGCLKPDEPPRAVVGGGNPSRLSNHGAGTEVEMFSLPGGLHHSLLSL